MGIKMKGKVIEYSERSRLGKIRGDDQNDYEFITEEWLDSRPILFGARVEFDIDEECGEAIQIYVIVNDYNAVSYTTKLDQFSNQRQAADQFKVFDWFIKALKQYADFSGRARRKEYWFFHLCYVVFLLFAAIIDAVLGAGYLIVGICAVLLWLPSVAVAVRRLHDIGISGWWIFIPLIPYLGSLIFFIFMIKPTKAEVNQWGNPAK